MSDLNKSKVYQKAYAFSVCVVNVYKLLCENHKEYTLSRQLLRCGTSIGANIAEANGAISENDFSSKMSIA
jgi:four helix bundle protein